MMSKEIFFDDGILTAISNFPALVRRVSWRFPVNLRCSGLTPVISRRNPSTAAHLFCALTDLELHQARDC